MSLTELPREPESTSTESATPVPGLPVPRGAADDLAAFDDAVLDCLAPSFAAADVDDLRSRVHGPVYAAGDDGMAAEVATWNVAVQHTPAIAVGATCAADVVAAVSWAVAHELGVAMEPPRSRSGHVGLFTVPPGIRRAAAGGGRKQQSLTLTRSLSRSRSEGPTKASCSTTPRRQLLAAPAALGRGLRSK